MAQTTSRRAGLPGRPPSGRSSPGWPSGSSSGARPVATAQPRAAASQPPRRRPRKVPAGTKMPAKIYKSESEFPAGWLSRPTSPSVTGVSFDGPCTERRRRPRCRRSTSATASAAAAWAASPAAPRRIPTARAAPSWPRRRRPRQAGQGPDRDPTPTSTRSRSRRGRRRGGRARRAGRRRSLRGARARARGPKAAKVTIVEFSDFQCPFCRRVEPTLKGQIDKYAKDVAVVFVNQPLPFHDNAMDAATAFQAAARQGKAWEMHDKMFANQQALTRPTSTSTRRRLGLNMARFKKDLDDPKIKDAIAEDQTLAHSVGANGTPTFFINGREFVGAQPFEAFKAMIDEEIEEGRRAARRRAPSRTTLYAKLMRREAAAGRRRPPPRAAAPGAQGRTSTSATRRCKGPGPRPVTIVAEFTDFQCPFCSRVGADREAAREGLQGQGARSPSSTTRCPSTTTRAAGRRGGAGRQRAGQVLGDARQAVRQPAGARPRRRSRSTPRSSASTWPSSRPRSTPASSRTRSTPRPPRAPTVGATGTPTFFINGRQLVGRAAVRRLQGDDRRGAEGQEGLSDPSAAPGVIGRRTASSRRRDSERDFEGR